MESKPGEGTTFRVYLPSARIAHAEEKKQLHPIPEGQECILFVDDEGVLVDIGQKLLKKLGYTVIARTSPLEALEVFRNRSEEIDLVISDLTMPNMTGDVLAREIMRLKPDIPVILCSGYSEKINQENALSMGVKKFIMKPLVLKKLANTIREVLDEE